MNEPLARFPAPWWRPWRDLAFRRRFLVGDLLTCALSSAWLGWAGAGLARQVDGNQHLALVVAGAATGILTAFLLRLSLDAGWSPVALGAAVVALTAVAEVLTNPGEVAIGAVFGVLGLAWTGFLVWVLRRPPAGSRRLGFLLGSGSAALAYAAVLVFVWVPLGVVTGTSAPYYRAWLGATGGSTQTAARGLVTAGMFSGVLMGWRRRRGQRHDEEEGGTPGAPGAPAPPRPTVREAVVRSDDAPRAIAPSPLAPASDEWTLRSPPRSGDAVARADGEAAAARAALTDVARAAEPRAPVAAGPEAAHGLDRPSTTLMDALEAMHVVRYRPLARDPTRGGYVPTRRVVLVAVAIALFSTHLVESPRCRVAREAYRLFVSNPPITRYPEDLTGPLRTTYMSSISYSCPGDLLNPPINNENAGLDDWIEWWLGSW